MRAIAKRTVRGTEVHPVLLVYVERVSTIGTGMGCQSMDVALEQASEVSQPSGTSGGGASRPRSKKARSYGIMAQTGCSYR
jgi:hypothetical protein